MFPSSTSPPFPGDEEAPNEGEAEAPGGALVRGRRSRQSVSRACQYAERGNGRETKKREVHSQEERPHTLHLHLPLAILDHPVTPSGAGAPLFRASRRLEAPGRNSPLCYLETNFGSVLTENLRSISRRTCARSELGGLVIVKPLTRKPSPPAS